MKYVFLLLIILVCNYNVHSQSINQLEEKKGFKDFKLGQEYSAWMENITLLEGTAYEYTGTCCKEIFTYKVEQIILIFQNEKLSEIQISSSPLGKSGESFKGDIAYSEFEKLNSNFSLLFGSPTNIKKFPPDGKSPDIGYFWIGANVELSSLLFYKGFKKGYYPLIVIRNKNILLEEIKNGF